MPAVIYDCRKEGKEPGSIGFPCNVKIVDPQTGERIPNVFYVRTSPARLGRFVVGADGTPLVDRKRWQLVPVTNSRVIVEDTRAKAMLDSKREAGALPAKLYERLEVWEDN